LRCVKNTGYDFGTRLFDINEQDQKGDPMGLSVQPKKFILLLSAFLLVACGNKKDKIHLSAESQSSLILNQLTVESVTPFSLDALHSSVITHKRFLIKACFVDGATLSKLSGIEMTIDGQQNFADASGCLFWSQEVAIPDNGNLQFIKYSKEISISLSPQFKKTVSYQINPYDGNIINLEHIDPAQTTADAKADANDNLSLENLNVGFVGFTKKNSSTTQIQEFVSKLDACIKTKSSLVKMDRLIGQSVEVIIRSTDKIIEKKMAKVDGQGCIQLSYKDQFPLMSENSWKKRIVSIQQGDRVLLREYGINPFEIKGEFFWDYRRGPSPRAATQDKPRLVVDKMRYTFVGNEDDGFRINEFLELSLVKSYQLELEPSLSFGHEFRGDVGPRPMFNGQFKIHFVLLSPKQGDMEINANNLSEFDVLSRYDSVVELRDGKINTTIELPFLFVDFPKAVTRTLAIVKLEAVDTPELNAIVTGPFHASTHQFSVGMREFESFESGEKLESLNLTVQDKLNHPSPVKLTKEGTLTSNWKVSPLELYRELHKNVEGMDSLVIKTQKQAVSDLKLSVTDGELKNFIRGQYSARDLNRFCSVIYPSRVEVGYFWDSTIQDPKFSSCMREPQKYLQVKGLKHIQKITSIPERVYSSTDRINIGSGFFFFQSESERESRSRRWSTGADIGMKFEIPFLKIVSAGAKTSYDISYMTSKDLSTGSTSRGSLSRTRNIYADMLRLRFEANTLSCLNIQGEYYQDGKTIKRSSKRLQICENNLNKEMNEESWYYMGESDPTMSMLRDRWSHKENMMIKLLRGQKNFEAFYNLMADDTKVVFLQKVETLKGPDAYYSRIYSDQQKAPSIEDGAIPGTIDL